MNAQCEDPELQAKALSLAPLHEFEEAAARELALNEALGEPLQHSKEDLVVQVSGGYVLRSMRLAIT